MIFLLFHSYNQYYHYHHQNYHLTIIVIVGTFFRITGKMLFLTSEKKDQVTRIEGKANLGNARK